nr:hypothetical protein BaRGS_004349 [Batillaria attramentaria]
MTRTGESLREASSPTSLLTTKTKTRIGTWNIRTLYESGKSAQVASEMRRYNIKVLGLCETRWNGSGQIRLSSCETIIYSGHGDTEHDHTQGVALLLAPEAARTLLAWEPVSARLLSARLNSKGRKITIIQCYAPTNAANEEEKEEFYSSLQSVFDRTPRRDMKIVMGDLNAKVGDNNTDRELVMGRHGVGTCNENGELFTDFCSFNNLVIGGTIYPHKKIHKTTWTSPDGKTDNQIDHFTIDRKWRRSLLDVRAEIARAIKSLKNGKAAGPDGIPPEALKSDTTAAAEALHPLLHKIWEQEQVPSDWKLGYLVKLPKKGDLSQCGNWRGIMLLSIPSKVLTRIILERLKEALDKRLRPEQAGFRQDRSCTDHIATLRIILEQSIEWQSPLYTSFVDFEKAFDSVDREAIWKLMQHYGIPSKLINIIQQLYEDSTCQIIHNGKLTNPFPVKTGVRQGCILSPTIFLVVIDWIMRGTTEGSTTGIQWTFTKQLEDLDFADDISLLSHKQQHAQSKLTRLAEEAGKRGLKINTSKTEVMRLNNKQGRPLQLHGEDIKETERFVYLGSIARLQLAQGHLNWNNVRWQNVLFSDESRFCIDHADGRVREWRRRGDRYADNCVVENNAWGGPSLMLWGAIGHNQVLGPVIFQGLGPGRGNGITVQRYMDQSKSKVFIDIGTAAIITR